MIIAVCRGVRMLAALLMAATIVAGVAAANATVLADDRHPLLLPGKTTLFQRVLTRPGAALRASPLADAQILQDDVPPFTVFYVYDRRDVGGNQWLEVGRASQGPTDGWIVAPMTVDWDTNMSVVFTNPAGRDRLLLFGDRDPLVQLLQSDDAAEQADALRATLATGEYGDDFPVISIEPGTYVDIRRQFYLLPIMGAEELYLPSGFTTRVLEVASVALDDTVLSATAATAPPVTTAKTDFSVGITFVVDTSLSMDPYIDRTREAIDAIYQRLQTADLNGQVSFGLVGYRDNVEAVPGLEYNARVFANLDIGHDPGAFFENIVSVSAATVSSRNFYEDAFSGMLTAIQGMPWEDFGGRYIILVTDAGARRGNDPLGATGLDAAQIRQLALDRGIAVYVLHLLTPAGRDDHETAAAQYTTLSEFPAIGGSLYYPVESGSVERFGQVVDTLGQALVDHVRQAEEAVAGNSAPEPVVVTQPDELTRIQREATIVGNAMVLAYLGRTEGTRAPSVFSAWTTDRDLRNPAVPALDVRVLLSKTQLSDLQEVLKAIVEAGKVGQLAPTTFFDQLRSAAVTFSRDPERIAQEGARTLGELGLIGEYLEGLPYRSKVMTIDEDLWLSWSVGEQQAFIDEIEAKIRLYQTYHDDVDRWIALDGGRVPGDAVYPVPLDALP